MCCIPPLPIGEREKGEGGRGGRNGERGRERGGRERDRPTNRDRKNQNQMQGNT